MRILPRLALVLVLGTTAVLPMACDDEVVVDTPPPPPPPMVEVGVAPYPGAIWVHPHWVWSGGRYVAMGGHWERPRPGYAWEHPRWVATGRRWRWSPGYWRRH